MKSIRIRSRRVVFVLAGVVVLGGGSGAAALYLTHTDPFGAPQASTNGLECSTVQTVKIKRAGQYWVRKYVVADSPDGMARVRTAVRVARTVQKAEKADLVQIAILDKAGPTDRSAMRGRAIGAQVIFTPEPSKVPDGVMNHPLSAFYLDGGADAGGQYYGMRVDLPYEDIDAVSIALTDFADCLEPVVASPEGDHGGGHGAAPAHGAAKGKEHGSGHGEPSGGGHGEASGEGHGEDAETVPADAHGSPAAESHEGQEEGADEVVASTPQGKGFLASVMGMVFGDKPQEPPVIDQNTTAASDVHPESADHDKAEAPAHEPEHH